MSLKMQSRNFVLQFEINVNTTGQQTYLFCSAALFIFFYLFICLTETEHSIHHYCFG